jgi:Potential Queuosine, Q, salvage protein family
LFKKAQLLALQLHTRFSASNPELFRFQDIEQLPIFVDNVIPTILHHLGIIPLVLTEELSQHQREIISGLQEDLKMGRETTAERSAILRASALDACEQIVEEAKRFPDASTFLANLTTEQLDAYLWRLAKKGSFRDITRFCDKHTIFF